MHFHLPKPLHGWRAFFGEVGIIVVGVLIALGAGQVVELVHDRQVAEEARENVRAEAAMDLGFLQGRASVQGCIERRLAALSAILGKAGEGTPQPQPDVDLASADGPFLYRAVAGGDGKRAQQPVFGQGAGAVRTALSNLRPLQRLSAARAGGLGGPEGARNVAGAARRRGAAGVREDLQQAKYLAWDLNYAGTYALRTGAAMGLAQPRRARAHGRRFAFRSPRRAPKRCANWRRHWASLEQCTGPRGSPIIPQHRVREAVAVARLIGVAAAVHVGEVEAADGAQAVGVREEGADRGGAADLGAEDVRPLRQRSG